MDTHNDIHIYGDIYARYPTNRHADCFPILYRRTNDHAAALADETTERDANRDDGAGTPKCDSIHGCAGGMGVGTGMALDASGA